MRDVYLDSNQQHPGYVVLDIIEPVVPGRHEEPPLQHPEVRQHLLPTHVT
jgi:hypothetical protein